MKIKDLERTANVAWSPANQNPIYLAAGTAAQQLDASFNTNAALEIYSLNLADPGPDMVLKSSAPTEHRFHRIVWGAPGVAGENGTIVGGCDNGLIEIYNATKLLNGENALVSKPNKHTGPVNTLDFNPFQQNLLATGASESEIFIWDMNNTNTPMTPGAKSQPLEDVLSISWNRQVQHILASTFAAKCVVWDLRKNEPIIKLTDTVSRIRWKVVAWHPEVATQLCLASEEDQAPIIQLWDLRFATSPLKTLENHQRGILSLAWCRQDADLLVSCGKDNRILCWNPNSSQAQGEVLSEIARTNQWSFDVAWCPRNPAVIASPNFDGHVAVYSLMGGKTQQIQTSNKIADSFPGMDGYIQAPLQQQQAGPVSVDLSKPPKWLKRSVGASFGFGGKLLTFTNENTPSTQNVQPGQAPPVVPRYVYVSQVVTEQELINKSNELEQALEYGNFTEYCLNKANSTSDQHKKYIWHFLKANFEQNPRREILNLLGYNVDDINQKLNQLVGRENDKIDGITDQFANNRIDGPEYDEFSSIQQQQKKLQPYRIKTGNDEEGLIAQALLLGNTEAAVELCLKAKRFADAIIISMTGGPELLAKAQYRYLEQSEGYLSSLISALVSEDWSSVVNTCDINSWKEALSATLTYSSEDDLPLLCEQLGSRLEREGYNNPKLLQEAQLCYIVAGSFEKLVNSWSANAKASTTDLQELIELVTFLQKSIERQGRQVEVSGSLADLLSYYASLLASQGSLNTALNYLGASQDEKVVTLRERLYVSLGQKPAYGHVEQSRKNSMRQSFSNYTNQPIPGYNTNVPNAVSEQPWKQPQPIGTYNPLQPPTTFSPGPSVPPPSQPPRPGSVGSAHGGSGLPSRSKYIVDPSVQSNQYGLRTQYAPAPVANPVFQPQQFQTNAVPDVPRPAPVPPSIPTPMLNPVPLNSAPNPPIPNPTLNPGPFSPPQNSFAPPPGVGQAPFPGILGAAGFGGGATDGVTDSTGQSAMNYLPPTAAPGWNDPPVFNRAPRPQPKQSAPPPSTDPITHPLYGAAPVQNPPYNNGYPDPNQSQMFSPAPQYNQPPVAEPPQMLQPSNFQQPPPPFGAPQQMFQQNAFNQPPPTQNIQQSVVEKQQPVEKPPIPEEHQLIQGVFDELRNRCSCAASNPQLKRKLEEVVRKLEVLYDLLRDHKLSSNALANLHQMVQLVQNGDYTSGLALHTQMVSGPDFAQIASFMPGLKILLQCALQLQVYLR